VARCERGHAAVYRKPDLHCFQINRPIAPTRRVQVRASGTSLRKEIDPMMIIEDQEHLDKVHEFARSVGAEAELQKQLDLLAGFGGDAAKVRCHLYRDFALHSFLWRIEHSTSDGWKPGLVGGLIYSGPGAERRLRPLVQRQPEPRCGQRPQAHVVHPHLSRRTSAHY
jgi:hypothetical protein